MDGVLASFPLSLALPDFLALSGLRGAVSLSLMVLHTSWVLFPKARRGAW